MSYQDIRSCYEEPDDPPEPGCKWWCEFHNTVFENGEYCDLCAIVGYPMGPYLPYEEE